MFPSPVLKYWNAGSETEIGSAKKVTGRRKDVERTRNTPFFLRNATTFSFDSVEVWFGHIPLPLPGTLLHPTCTHPIISPIPIYPGVRSRGAKGRHTASEIKCVMSDFVHGWFSKRGNLPRDLPPAPTHPHLHPSVHNGNCFQPTWPILSEWGMVSNW